MVVDNNISNSQNGQDGKDDVQCGRPRVFALFSAGIHQKRQDQDKEEVDGTLHHRFQDACPGRVNMEARHRQRHRGDHLCIPPAGLARVFLQGVFFQHLLAEFFIHSLYLLEPRVFFLVFHTLSSTHEGGRGLSAPILCLWLQKSDLLIIFHSSVMQGDFHGIQGSLRVDIKPRHTVRTEPPYLHKWPW